MKIKTYVINLKESVSRRERVLTEIQKYPCLNVEFVEAVNGKKMSVEEINRHFDSHKFVRRAGRNPLPGEIGCVLSHNECYRRLLDSNDNIALILEDDVCFLDQEHFESILMDISQKMVQNIPCVLTLSRHNLYYKNKIDKIGEYSLYRIREAWGMCAYIINKKAADKILSMPKPYYVADDFLLLNKKNITVYGIHPMLALSASEFYDFGLYGKEGSEKYKIETTIWKDEDIVWEKSLRCLTLFYYNKIYHCLLLLLQVLKRRSYYFHRNSF